MMKTPLPKEFVWTIGCTKTGFSAFEKDWPLFTTSHSAPQLLNQCYEAAALYFDEPEMNIQKVKHRFVWHWRSLFAHYKIFNAQMFAQRIGMNASLLTQYIKATKSPSPQQEKKIINGIRRIGKELSLIEI